MFAHHRIAHDLFLSDSPICLWYCLHDQWCFNVHHLRTQSDCSVCPCSACKTDRTVTIYHMVHEISQLRQINVCHFRQPFINQCGSSLDWFQGKRSPVQNTQQRINLHAEDLQHSPMGRPGRYFQGISDHVCSHGKAVVVHHLLDILYSNEDLGRDLLVFSTVALGGINWEPCRSAPSVHIWYWSSPSVRHFNRLDATYYDCWFSWLSIS